MRITEELIRRKAEHHDGSLPDLEELTLHQLEIEKIEVVGTLCRKLKILYLQNNIISRMEGFYHLKDLSYLNLALNNIALVEGLTNCEFLKKLDLTVNFVDFDALEASVEHLAPLLHLRELFLMGNPCTTWDGLRDYVAASLPQVVSLDGTQYSRADTIRARQRLPELRRELHPLAAAARERKGLPAEPEREYADDEPEAYTPQSRVRMYREMAEQKAEQEARKRGMEPRARDAAAEHEEAVARARAGEAERGVRQTNEGRWEFVMEDEGGPTVALRLAISRFLDTSLVDVDVHPTYVSVVVKNKTFRILWPREVRAAEGVCTRSTVTGELVVTVPAVVPGRLSAPRPVERVTVKRRPARDASGRTTTTMPKPLKLGDELAAMAAAAGRAPPEVHISQATQAAPPASFVDDEDVPPLE
jgi:protein TilB